MFKVTVEDLRNLGGPMYREQTTVVDEVFFHHVENAKDWCLQDYRRAPWRENVSNDAIIEWKYIDDKNLTSGDLITVMYSIQEIFLEDNP